MNFIIILFSLLGIIGVTLALVFPFIVMYFWLKDKILKRRIPEQIKREVENDRQKKELRREEAGRKYRGGDDNSREDRTFRETISDSTAADRVISRNRETFNRRNFPPLSFKDNAATERTDEREQRSPKRNWKQFS